MTTSRDAAVNQAAYEVLSSLYPGEAAILSADYNSRMAIIANGANKTNGIALGSQIAQAYLADPVRSNDHSGDTLVYMAGNGPGEWRPRPGQSAWGPTWGTVTPFAIGGTAPFIAALPPIPALTSQAYTDAFNQVQSFGDVNSVVRTADEKEMGLFWAYDRPTMGPPPVLFLRNLGEIAAQANNTPEQNARLFALASVSMADAAIAAWDAKFTNKFWRPIAAIQEADTDGNPNTIQAANWQPMGAPGGDPNSTSDDFTPPFPAWTSGHATMGGALFQAIEAFYGTNSFDAIDGNLGNNPTYTLTSQEFDVNGASGMSRDYHSFMQAGALDIGTENSPEGENGTSRVYLGIHWMFDQKDGIKLGNDIAAFVAANRFLPVPEPTGIALVAAALAGLVLRRRVQ